MSKFVDWSAREHDVTYVIGWPNKNDGRTAPSDAYNGITVAPAKFVGLDLVQVAIDVMEDPGTDSDADGIRTSTHIMAPGDGVPMMQPEDDDLVTANGSSFAAPHVTGAVAMLQQYAVQQIDAGNPAFHFRDSRRHQVMKAVLLNSADKFPGVHGSKRVAVNRDFTDWAGSPAANNSAIPLDQDFGAGMLNVRKAIEQYRGGETDPGAAGDVGWDHQRSGGIGDSFTYAFNETSAAGEYIAVTLAWDREVELTNPDDNYNQGDTFFNRGFEDSVNDLNLYLLDENDAVVARSTAADGTLEHIFFKVPAGGGEYKIFVEHEGSLFAQSDGVVAQSIDTQTDFGLAWWSYEPTSVTPGDYDGNGLIELADYTVWTESYGSTVFSGRGADGNLDGVIDAADYTVWRDAFALAATTASIPEPSAALLLAFALLSTKQRCWGNWSRTWGPKQIAAVIYA